MIDGRVKALFNRKITLFGLAAVLAALVATSFSGSALAYTADDPAVVYHTWVDQNEDGVIDAADEVADDEGNSCPR
jgi:ABC-type glycerol-3-phosphate transport system substrate-binding protein